MNSSFNFSLLSISAAICTNVLAKSPISSSDILVSFNFILKLPCANSFANSFSSISGWIIVSANLRLKDIAIININIPASINPSANLNIVASISVNDTVYLIAPSITLFIFIGTDTLITCSLVDSILWVIGYKSFPPINALSTSSASIFSCFFIPYWSIIIYLSLFITCVAYFELPTTLCLSSILLTFSSKVVFSMLFILVLYTEFVYSTWFFKFCLTES